MLVHLNFDISTYITHTQFKRAPWNDSAPLEEETI